MFSKKSSSKSKQRRASCLFFCFNGSIVAEPGQLESAPVAATDGPKHRCTWYSWSRFRKKKRPSPVAKSISVPGSNTASTQSGAKEKINRGQSMPQSPPKRQKSTTVDDQVSAKPQRPLLPHLTSKYSTRTRPEPPSYRSEPVHNRLKQDRSGSSEPGQPQTTASRGGQHRKLDTKAGLAVLGVTFGVMVIYGRVAAVVFLCALLYNIAALRRQPTLDEEAVEKRVAGEGDMTSKDYRKRVVLEGLLERGGRRPHALGNAIEL